MKKVLIAAALLASTMSFGQSNTKGTIHIGLGYGALLGGSKIENSYASTLDKTDGTVKYKGLGARGMTGIRVGYGIANAFSIGIFLRSESA
ncbi:MAG: hypothetical protein H7329_05735, partial [Opitutaceae bacterium]|nr:hypothetical protein [Cytophagales bacterium]